MKLCYVPTVTDILILLVFRIICEDLFLSQNGTLNVFILLLQVNQLLPETAGQKLQFSVI
jgi:hypothetical protein